jgi:hypothetical protein
MRVSSTVWSASSMIASLREPFVVEPASNVTSESATEPGEVTELVGESSWLARDELLARV